MPTPKWIRGTPSSPARASTRAEWGMHVRRVVRGGQRAGPRVEQLDRRRARRHLHLEVGRGDAAILRISASHTSGAPNIIALVFACSFDGPPSTRYDATVNGAPANPISGVPPSSATSPRTASVMNGTCSGVRSGIASTSAEGAHRRGDHRPDAGLDVEVDADGLERQHDVGEEDRRVHAVPADRLQRDLDDQLGVHAGLEHPDALAQLEVLRQRPAGLAHEPDRRVRDRLAAAALQERARQPRGARQRDSLRDPSPACSHIGITARPTYCERMVVGPETHPGTGAAAAARVPRRRRVHARGDAAPRDLLRGDAGAAADRALRRRAVRRRDRRRRPTWAPAGSSCCTTRPATTPGTAPSAASPTAGPRSSSS